MLEVKWKGVNAKVDLLVTTSFNPCYVGSKMESSLFGIDLQVNERFQSLLCWK